MAPILFILSIEPLLRDLKAKQIDVQSHCDDLAVVATASTLLSIQDSLMTYEQSFGALLKLFQVFPYHQIIAPCLPISYIIQSMTVPWVLPELKRALCPRSLRLQHQSLAPSLPTFQYTPLTASIPLEHSRVRGHHTHLPSPGIVNSS